MGLFSIIETFFFISLGITILLVALLVYHFKQRLSSLEQKYESLFDIVSSVVKQLSNIQSSPPMQPEVMGQFGGMYPPWMEPGHLGNMNIPSGFPPQMFSGEHVQYNLSQQTHPHINYSVEEDEDDDDDEDEEEEEEEEEDEDDEGEEDDESGEDDDDDEEDEEDDDEDESAKVIVSDGENHSHAGVKIINLDMDEPSINIEAFNNTPIALDETDDVYELPVQDVQNDYSMSLEQGEETSIVVKKVEDSLQEQPESIFIERTSAKDLYKKMTLSNLKATVIAKGLCSDPSKMKKNELLQLLEDE